MINQTTVGAKWKVSRDSRGGWGGVGGGGGLVLPLNRETSVTANLPTLLHRTVKNLPGGVTL